MTLPDFSFENKICSNGFKVIAGLDEVGRGSFAGPVITAAVVFAQNTGHKLPNPKNIKINDSKKLNSKQREIADKWIRENCLAHGIGSASVTQINKLGIKKATEYAFRQAVYNCGIQINHILVDAFYIPFVKGIGNKNQTAIMKGDTLSFSIAAASIVAKVYRDGLMIGLSKNTKYKKYEWHKNKGYGTKAHRQLILEFGATSLHRKKFVEKTLAKD